MRDAGGSRETVDATGGGLVYTTRDELRAALARLAGDIDFRQTLAIRALDGYRRLFTAEQHVARYLAYVDQVRATKQRIGGPD